MLTFPSFATIVAGSTDYASGFFNELLPFMWVAIGCTVGAVLVIFFRNVILDGMFWLYTSITGQTTPHDDVQTVFQRPSNK